MEIFPSVMHTLLAVVFTLFLRTTRTQGDGETLISVQDYYDAAKLKLQPSQPAIWSYIEGGSDDEFTMRQNRKAFQGYVIRPRVLRNVSTRNLSVMVLGKAAQFPVGIAPMALQKIVNREGECGTARGAGNVGAIFISSTLASTSIEDIAKCAPYTRRWFQLYFEQDREVDIDLINRAERAGYEAIVLTLDAQLVGKRRGYLRQPFELPEDVTLANFDNPSFFARRNNSDPVRDNSITWDIVDWIRKQTTLKLVLKGILTAEDAIMAAEAGVDAIIVSNHGGRQLDSVSPTIDALCEIVHALQKSKNLAMEVYMDGGISLGTDVFKALAVGAKMVFVGRGALSGLAVGGEDGVTKVMELYRDELDLTMGLAGVSSISQINSSFIRSYVPL